MKNCYPCAAKTSVIDYQGSPHTISVIWNLGCSAYFTGLDVHYVHDTNILQQSYPHYKYHHTIKTCFLTCFTKYSSYRKSESTGEKNQWTIVSQNAHINQYELWWLTISSWPMFPTWSTLSTNKTCSNMTQHINTWWWTHTMSEMSDINSTFTWLIIWHDIITS